MGTIFIIILAVAGFTGVVSLLASNKKDPKDRTAEAVGAAAGGAMMAGGCIMQLIFTGLAALVGLWVLRMLFAH